MTKEQTPMSAEPSYTDGGRNMFYKGRFNGETAREQKARLRLARMSSLPHHHRARGTGLPILQRAGGISHRSNNSNV